MVRIMMRNILVAPGRMTGCLAEKYEHQNLQSLQGSVGIHHSISTYTYGHSKSVQHCSYVWRKLTGILNSVHSKRQTRNLIWG
eukprot:15359459-Ditylum_brightwellii.AAC.1